MTCADSLGSAWLARTRAMKFVAALALALCLALGLEREAGGQGVVEPAVRVEHDDAFVPCNEPSMAASRAAPTELVAAWNHYHPLEDVQWFAYLGAGLSVDGGRTWTNEIVRAPLGSQALVEGDPMTAHDDRTGTLWVGGIAFSGTGGPFVARRDPGASTFRPAVMAAQDGGADKGWMTAGPVPGTPPATNLVVAYNHGVVHSLDMGDTWSPIVPIGTGLGHLPCIGPQGQVYVAWWDNGPGIWLRRSFDGGDTFGAPIQIAQRLDFWFGHSRTPGSFRVVPFNALAVDRTSGALYCVYPDTTNYVGADANVDVWFTRSIDQGLTWSVPVVINADAVLPGDQFASWLEVDERGRLHTLFYDTRHVAQHDTDPFAWLDAYWATSADGGQSWTETRLTPTSFSSLASFVPTSGQFIGDYLALSTAGGVVHPTYTRVTSAPQMGDVVVNVVRVDVAATFCHGLVCPCANDDPRAGCGNRGIDDDPTSGARLEGTGTDFLASDDLVLRATGLQPGTTGVLFAGRNAANALFGDGRRCVGGPAHRYSARAADTLGTLLAGPGEIVSFAAAHFGPDGAWTPGTTVHFQVWYRDFVGPCGTGSNLTHGVTVVWR